MNGVLPTATEHQADDLRTRRVAVEGSIVEGKKPDCLIIPG